MRRVRAELEEDYNERTKAAERRLFSEAEDAKNETIAVRKKLDEAMRQVRRAPLDPRQTCPPRISVPMQPAPGNAPV